MANKQKKGVNLTCQNKGCKHRWAYKGSKKKGYATCPMCLYKVNIEKAKR